LLYDKEEFSASNGDADSESVPPMGLTLLYMRAKTRILAHSGNSFPYAQTFRISDKAKEAWADHSYAYAKAGIFAYSRKDTSKAFRVVRCIMRLLQKGV
jgi:hypothetical protein